MSEISSHLGFLRDPRLSSHASSPLPVWLWSADATHVLWANPIAAAIFDAPTSAAIAGFVIDPKGTAALQIARLAASLPHGASPRLQRLRGHGAQLGQALMCACSRVTLADRTTGILVVATERAGPALSLAERASRLIAGIGEPAALYSADGGLLAATASAKTKLGDATTLTALGAGALAAEVLAAGRASGTAAGIPLTIERIGTDAAILLLAVLAPQPAVQATPIEAPVVPPPPQAPEAAAPPQAPIETSAIPEPVAPTTSETVAAMPPPPAEIAAPPQTTAPSAERRQPQQPLRFVWQMDADGRFTLGSDEFTAMIGPATAAALDQPWNEIAAKLGLDPDGHVARAFASRDTWSGITVHFPIDDTSERLAVELSGLPVFDRDRSFKGYRGFGVCRDVERLTRLTHAKAPAAPEPPPLREERATLTVVPPSPNVVPFRSSTPPEKAPSLTPVERKAFGELASRLTARLRDAENQVPGDTPIDEPPLPIIEAAPPAPPEAPIVSHAAEPPLEETRPMGSDQRPILDRLPVGVLVYRLDNLLYANRAFLDWTGYGGLETLAEAGGLDALFVEPGVDSIAPNGPKSLGITTQLGDKLPVEARLFSTPWDGESALVLMLAQPSPSKSVEHAPQRTETATDAEVRELRAILDTASDGVVLLDRDGRVTSLSGSAARLFGYASDEMAGLPFAALFAADSQGTALDGIAGAGAGLSDGREVNGRTHEGAIVPLFMTMGPIGDDKLCAVFRDITPWKRAEDELIGAKQQAEKASSAKSDFLAKISHEIRTPLNAIIGFSEVMMEERFGPIGNERYKQYLKDIHTSGGHLISLLNDLLDLSKIEAGKLDLNFASVELNELTQQCVALMQPQANRQRIIIRTSLSQTLPPVMADARSVRQIVLNLLSNSIKFTGAGGQVIVSTAINDAGEVVLRVRDTGVGMSEKDIAIALEPFRQLPTSARYGSTGTGLGLPLTKALAEANRATFSITSAVNAGTLVEVSFPGARLAAE